MTLGNASVPFLNFKSFISEESEATESESRITPAVSSPFLSIYELADGESAYDDPIREAYSSIVNELYDEEFDEALFELLTDARNLYQDHLTSGHSANDSERLVTQHFSQLARESEAMIDAVAREFGGRGEAGIVEQEIDSFFELYAPSSQIEPAFENFFGKLAKKLGKAVKKVAGKALQGIKKLALGPIFNKLKALIKPLLNRVLQRAIGKLPEPIQPAAQKLAEKLGLAAPKPPDPAEPAAAADNASTVAGAAGGDPAIPPENVGTSVQGAPAGDIASVQEEFDAQIAEALLAQDEAELELEVARLRSASSAAANPVYANLDDARERFIQELNNLRQGESAEPHIQNFLPAVLPALRLGIRLIGRGKVVNFLAQLLAKLISKLIGPDQAPALSRAIVDAGLKLMTLEMSEAEKSDLASSAVAATVEETINRVASLPEHILDNQELLEGFALEAFEQAAAANLPAVLSEAAYRQRPELLEGGVNLGWLYSKRARNRYKRCTKPFKIVITPQIAEEVESFEGVPLSDYLQDQLGLPEGAEVEAEVRLYEVLPGATLADIARYESEAPGLGSSDEAAVFQLHPLTEKAASAMLGKPGLGRALPPGSSRLNVAAGQRLFHLAISGKRPLTVPGKSGRARVRRLLHVNVTLDAPQDQIRVCIFFSEVKAQKLAVRLRQQAHAGSLTVGFHKMLARRIGPILNGQRPKRLRIISGGVSPAQPTPSVLQKLPGVISQAFIARMQEWLMQGFTDFIKTQSPKFLAAAEDPSDGVTLRFTLEHPPGLKELSQALNDKGPSSGKIAATIGQGPQPNVKVEVFPGHKCD